MLGAVSLLSTVSFMSTRTLTPGRSRATGLVALRTAARSTPAPSSTVGIAFSVTSTTTGVFEPEIDAGPLRSGPRYPPRERHRVQIGEHHDGLGARQADGASDLGGIDRDLPRIVRNVEHHLPLERHPLDVVRTHATAHQYRRPADRAFRHGSLHVPRGTVEGHRHRPVLDPKHDPRAVQLHPSPGNRIALEPGAVLASRLEPERLELVRDVLGRQLEPLARGVATQHRIVGDDADPVRHVAGFDGGGRGRGTGRGGLGRQRCCDGEEAGGQKTATHSYLSDQGLWTISRYRSGDQRGRTGSLPISATRW